VNLFVVGSSGQTTITPKDGFCTTQSEIQTNAHQTSSTDWVPFKAANTGKALKCKSPANATMCARRDDQCCNVTLGALNYPPVLGKQNHLKEEKKAYQK
jgi:hypothetical protein